MSNGSETMQIVPPAPDWVWGSSLAPAALDTALNEPDWMVWDPEDGEYVEISE